MPARNSIQKVVSDLNELAKPFNLTVSRVEHYQNVRNSKIVLIDTKNQQQTKSLEKWREFFRNIEKTDLPFIFKKPLPDLESRARAKASQLNHSISNFLFKSFLDSSCTVHCNTHNQTFEPINVANYLHKNNKYGLACCTSAFRKKRQRKQTTKEH
jgi:hypothetical protein